MQAKTLNNSNKKSEPKKVQLPSSNETDWKFSAEKTLARCAFIYYCSIYLMILALDGIEFHFVQDILEILGQGGFETH